MKDAKDAGRGILVAMVLAAVIGGGWWYMNVYDTAAAKCQRGDFGACLVYQAEHPTMAPVTEGPLIPAVDLTIQCTASVSGHDVVVEISADTNDTCDRVQTMLLGAGFQGFPVQTVSVPAGDKIVCTVNSLTWVAAVWDSGMAMYGSQACELVTKRVND
ncbi:MAG: hypothetical protein ABSD62_14695 [Candidatus Limnocylindrales bacterium]|jgi:hypothetical protein